MLACRYKLHGQRDKWLEEQDKGKTQSFNLRGQMNAFLEVVECGCNDRDITECEFPVPYYEQQKP